MEKKRRFPAKLGVSLAFAAMTLLIVPEPVLGQDPLDTEKLVLISDTHMGLGKAESGKWSATEDFRWSGALKGFLDYASAWGNEHVTLIIIGDFLEMWQPPADIPCVGKGNNLGCTIDEMVKIAKVIVAAHGDDLKLLRKFAVQGKNRVVIIPGNHDAALVLDPVWQVLEAALQPHGGGIERIVDGIWYDKRLRVLVEHGHQIGSDPNSYRKWPSITKSRSEKIYLIRPWGERFVQRIFNDVEAQYPIIDNLSPSSAGARYRMEDQNPLENAADIAQFILFNIFETSLRQKIAILGEEGETDDGPNWDIPLARDLGSRLFSESLLPDDSMRAAIQADSAEGEKLRDALDSLAHDEDNLSDTEVEMLCDRMAVLGSSVSCRERELGALIEAKLIPRERVLRKHLKNRLRKYSQTGVFIYGHTHKYEVKWALSIDQDREIQVLNTGAFQRVMNDEDFRARADADGIEHSEALSSFRLEEDFLPCYTFVQVEMVDQAAQAKTWQWYSPEGAQGERVRPGHGQCRYEQED